MGSYYTSCPRCGEEISGRWDVDVDTGDEPEPHQVTERRREHDITCIPRHTACGYIEAHKIVVSCACGGLRQVDRPHGYRT